MANPYHDADGKFCSRGEMETAIQHAASNNELDTYFSLRKDLEDIDAARVKEGYEFGSEPSATEELMNKIRDYGGSTFAENIMYPSYRLRGGNGDPDNIYIHELGDFKKVASYEIDDDLGGTQDLWVVFEHEDRLYKLTGGTWTSYDGREWNNVSIKQVKRREQLVVNYEPID